MHTATYEMAIEAAGFLFSPVQIAVAAAVWLLLGTGIVGRVVQHLEELPHLRAQAKLGYFHTPAATAERTPAAGREPSQRLVGITPKPQIAAATSATTGYWTASDVALAPEPDLPRTPSGQRVR